MVPRETKKNKKVGFFNFVNWFFNLPKWFFNFVNWFLGSPCVSLGSWRFPSNRPKMLGLWFVAWAKLTYGERKQKLRKAKWQCWTADFVRRKSLRQGLWSETGHHGTFLPQSRLTGHYHGVCGCQNVPRVQKLLWRDFPRPSKWLKKIF